MANIMSGLFAGGSGSNALALAQYNQRLQDYEDEKEAFQQQQSVGNMDPYIKQVLEEMSPERQNMMMLQRQMMKNPATFDAGQQGFGQMMQQRGTTIADILKQEEGVTAANLKHQYKVDNPIPGQGGHKLEYAIEYAGGREAFDNLSDDERMKLMDRAARARQLVDKGTHWEDVVSGETYSKNLADVEIAKEVGGSIGERLMNHKTNRRAQQGMVTGFSDSLAALHRLHEGASNWTTGYGAFLRHLPKTDAAEWFAELETVNSQTVLDTMKELKSMSQAGATGFGAVNERELMVMMDKWGKIIPGMDDDDIKEIITRRIGIMERINKKVEGWMQNEDDWYRRNRYNIPKAAQEPLDDEPGTLTIFPKDDKSVTETPGFSIID